MKGLSFFVLLLVMIGAVAGAQISLSGEANAYLNVFPAFPYTSSRFDSPLNPGNISGIQDVALDTDVTFRLEAGRETGTLTLWLAVDPYRMGQLLLAAASGDPVQQETVAGGLSVSDPAALSVLRANIAWYIGQAFVLRLGRQSMLTGYGYGWNPMDFANTAKDPFDPEAELRGVDALSLQFYLGNLFALKLSGIFRLDSFMTGADYQDLQVGAELTVSFPMLELKLSGYYDHDDIAGEDAFVPAVGAGFMFDLSGVGIYGEGALLWGGRVPAPIGVSMVERRDDLLACGLFGVEYTFASELRLIAEYFYNGEGYSLQERELYKESLEDQYLLSSYIPGEYAAIYRPGYFAKHYLLLNLGYPIYPWNTSVELSTYYSPDSSTLGIMPSAELEVSGSLSVRGGYMGMFSLQENRYDEAWFSPFKHVVELRLTYYF
jgi:hypothetical protein